MKKNIYRFFPHPFDSIIIVFFILIYSIFGVHLSGDNQPYPSIEILAESQEKNMLMEGKQKTDLTISFDYVVDGSPQQIFNLWTTVSGIKKFFGVDAVVDLKVGGSYEIYFLPFSDPQSDPNSTKGAKLLGVEKDKKLVFEWKMPPFASELNINPLPTWVEVDFEALEKNPNKTHVSLKHYGFKRGEKWENVFEFFSRNWALILYRLDMLCANDFPMKS